MATTSTDRPAATDDDPELDPFAELGWGRRTAPKPDPRWARPEPPPVGLAERWERVRASRWGSPGRLVAAAFVVLAVAGGGWWLLRPMPAAVDASIPMASPGGTAGTSVPGAEANSAASVASGASGPVGASGGASSGASSGAVATDPVSGSTTTRAPDVVVQAAGAVVRPGVYRMAGSARVDDLIARAGGLAPSADGNRINLAAPLADGERLWVPKVGELGPPPLVGADGTAAATGPASSGLRPGSGSATSTSAPPAIVDLNTATADQLDTLPGVGPSTAQAIVAYRAQHGRFSTVDELLEVRGIGDAKLADLRPYVTV